MKEFVEYIVKCLVDNPDDADYILLSHQPDKYRSQVSIYSKYKDKMVVWVNNDDPNSVIETIKNNPTIACQAKVCLKKKYPRIAIVNTPSPLHVA